MLRIKKPITFTATFLVASFLLYVSAQPLTSGALTQEGAMPPSPKGKMHDWLAQDAGTWEVAGVMQSPMGEMEFVGTETITIDCGGLWAFSTFESEIMGLPFKGRSATGYDPEKKKFVGAWVDSMTPRMVLSEGERQGETLIMYSDAKDPETGATYREKQVSRREGPDKRVFQMIDTRAGETVTMEIVYTRKK